MIRDPSDGSVREPQKSAPPDVGSLPSGESDPSVTIDLGGADTGLGMTTALPPLPKDAKEAARLVESRNWLQSYHKTKGQ